MLCDHPTRRNPTLTTEKADISDKNSLIAAFRGADAVFAVTDYWSIMSKSKEISYGKDIAEACQANKVQHLIWSTLEDVNKGWYPRSSSYLTCS